jgi:hypothetical protein
VNYGLPFIGSQEEQTNEYYSYYREDPKYRPLQIGSIDIFQNSGSGSPKGLAGKNPVYARIICMEHTMSILESFRGDASTFQRNFGTNPETFAHLLGLLKEHAFVRERERRGRPKKLNWEQSLIMMLEHSRGSIWTQSNYFAIVER